MAITGVHIHLITYGSLSSTLEPTRHGIFLTEHLSVIWIAAN